MIRNYLKIAFRNLLRNKAYSAINILGLSIGICASLALYLIISFELSFDTFHSDKNRLFRVIGEITESTGDKLNFVRIPLPLSQAARTQIADIETITGLIPFKAKVQVIDDKKQIKEFESNLAGTKYITTAIAEPEYFQIFHYDWLAGNASTALKTPLSVVLTENKARQYFGAMPITKIIGKEIIYQDSLHVTVSGIIKEFNGNSDIAFTDFISFSSLKSGFLRNTIAINSWNQGDMNTWTFVKISKEASVQKINSELQKLVKTHANNEIKLSPGLEPISNIHFNADLIENPIRTAHLPTLYGLMGITIFILILAIINFINLSTAQAIQKGKEVSVRKIMGSSRISLIFQFLFETFIFVSISLSIALLSVNPVLRTFQSFIPNGISLKLLDSSTITFILLIIFIIPILAGLYPALEISSNKPILNLNANQPANKKTFLRKGLIVFQFTVSLFFIVGSIVVNDQINFIRHKDLGFKTDAILNIDSPRGADGSKLDVFKEKIKQLAEVKLVAKQWQAPMHDNPREMKLKLKSDDIKDFWVKQIAGDEDFIPLYEIKLLAGRNLVKTDTVNELIINENLAKYIGALNPRQALGKTLYWNDKLYPVVGVVADFHSKSLHETISPLCIINRPDRESSLAIKLGSKGTNSEMIESSLLKMESIWKDIYPDKTFNYQFFDDSLAKLYEKDQKTAFLINTSVLITIFISCIGLFGLGMFTTQKRTKEIGIRKILGASITSILTMLTKDFVILIIIALLVATPLSWLMMNRWLQEFAYHINISWVVYVLAGFSAIVIALLTVSYQAIKVALANPVKSLKTE